VESKDTDRVRHTAGLLKGWKAIAQHFGRSQSTVRRWATSTDLPVYRAAGEKGLSVYAYVDELDAWLTRRDDKGATPSPGATPSTTTSPSPTTIPNTTTKVPPTLPDEKEGSPATLEPARFELTRRHLLFVLLLLLITAGVTTAWIQQQRAAPVAVHSVETVPDEARELYLRGTYLWNRRTPASIAGAKKALKQAIDLHPNYAEAHAGLAMAYNLARQYSDMPGREAYPKAEIAARRAIELAPSLDLAHSALAFVEFYWYWQIEAGLARFEKATRLGPGSANTLIWYSNALLLVGRPDEALPIANRAQTLAPDSSAVVNIKAQALFYSGQVEEALDLVTTMIAEDPRYAWNYSTHAFIQLSQENYDDYLASYARLGDLIGVPRYRAAAEAGAAALAEGGVEAMARTMFEVKRELYERGEAPAWDLARHQALLGNRREALSWLHISLKRKEESLIGIQTDPCFWPLRDDPDYRLLLTDIGFPSGL